MQMDKDYLPDIPIFVYHGALDSIVPISNVHVTYKNWCDWGSTHLNFLRIY